ncbi:synaptophysin / synaptoporin [Onchocerca flexuosa]|uniref:Synaptophysin / synaptoporin n=1 Tax=Onchocerca flexuosa TaxID=387005 RepID=A0A238BUC7_9BILA|nr:synaptophysin / synaptoporin [Onchocerca flexuosa]
MENIRAYGAGMAGGQFQPAVFLRKPAVILRIFALVVGLAQWIAISRGGWYKPENDVEQICLYANSSSTCSFGSAMGFFAVLSSLGLLFLEAKFEKISSIPTRKRAVTTDMILSALLAFLFLITFFSLWSKYGEVEISEPYSGGMAKSAILFALLSFVTWGASAFLAWRRYEEGSITNFVPSYEQNFGSGIQTGPDYSYGGESDIGATG